jgi:hypothetical protein
MSLSVMTKVVFDKATIFRVIEDIPNRARMKAAAAFRALSLLVQHVRNRVKRQTIAVQLDDAQNDRGLQMVDDQPAAKIPDVAERSCTAGESASACLLFFCQPEFGW